jgi:hypothetical protein
VLIESARPAEQASAFADLYGLTGHERAITTYTVQDHLPRFAGIDAG